MLLTIAQCSSTSCSHLFGWNFIPPWFSSAIILPVAGKLVLSVSMHLCGLLVTIGFLKISETFSSCHCGISYTRNTNASY